MGRTIIFVVDVKRRNLFLIEYQSINDVKTRLRADTRFKLMIAIVMFNDVTKFQIFHSFHFDQYARLITIRSKATFNIIVQSDLRH